MSNQSKTKSVFKKIQTLVPGFKSYVEKEDLRANDLVLRNKMQSSLGVIREELEKAKRNSAREGDLDKVSRFTSLSDSILTLENKCKYAERGYSAVFQTKELDQGFLASILSHDEQLVELADSIEKEEFGAKLIDDSFDHDVVISRILQICHDCERVLKERRNLMKGLA